VIPLLAKLVSQNKKVILFRATRGDTVGAAHYLALSLKLPAASDAIALLPQSDQSNTSSDLRACLQHGVGFHNSDLDARERAALETTFRDPNSPLRVLVATTTLAMGVNTPAEAVVIAGLTHPGGVAYSVAEYKNMVGRAGRLGHVDAGESFIIAVSDPTPNTAWEHYVKGAPEDITSHFLSATTDPQTLIVRSLAALGATVEEDELVRLLENSFALWLDTQAGGTGWNRDHLRESLELLLAGGLVDREPNGQLTLAALGRYAGESGIEVRSITNIASALRFAPPTLSSADIIALAQVTLEMQPLWIPTNRRSRQEQARWPATLQQLGVDQGLMNALHVGGEEPLARSKRAVACLLYVSDTRMTEIEQILLQHTRDNAAAGNIRAVASRTRDVIDAVVRVATLGARTMQAGVNVDDLGIQLELGIPESMVPLAQSLGSELSRGQYLDLNNAGLRTRNEVVTAGEQRLASILGDESGKRVLGLLTDA
jgi:helicase